MLETVAPTCVQNARFRKCIPTMRIRFTCNNALRGHEIIQYIIMATTTTETKPPNPTHVQHCYNIVFGAVRVMWRWLANRYVKFNFDSTYSDPSRLHNIMNNSTFLQEERKKTIRNLCYLNRMRTHTCTVVVFCDLACNQ